LISNTGPILALSGAGCLELIRNLYSSVTVPKAVHEELIQGGKSGLGLSAYVDADWIQVEPQGRIDPLLLAQLDQGEAAVITLALNKNNQATLIDERKARRIARTIYGLEVFGTVRVLLEAKKAGFISNVFEILNLMRANGYWIHDNIVEYALGKAGEK
jgi:predicted nucleic acid-binding protein